ncbi:TetR/AcrR family transcriptional regulator [Virgibacillus ndiopensis]|uniref:TetR/AcrR family transcriptional regulator n=1 Tax=Virgibacillus ndiopensis TaxID=2004408 RepID=UPI000C074DB0|nr:TetR/AcrR family transcriptional regulator [Virgibacillus ndiopensis]
MEKLNELRKSKHRLTKKGEETRSQIVSAAAELMFEKGVSGTSVGDVQKKAQVSSSQLYHYFKEKRELVKAVIIYQTEKVLSTQESLVIQLDSIEALKTWRDAIVQLQNERQCRGGCPIGSLASELSDIDTDARSELEVGFMQWENFIRKGLRTMQERGELSTNANPDELALALLTTLQGGLLLTQVRKETLPLEVGLDSMLTHISSFII